MPQNIEAQIEQFEAQVEELCEQEQYEEAIKISKKICELASQHYGYEHQDYATTLSDLAGLYQVIGEYQKAEQFYLQALRIDEFALGKDSTDYASDLQDLARLYHAMGQQDKAVQLYKQSLQIELKKLGPEHPGYRRSLQELETWLKQSNQPIAQPMVKQAALSPTAEIEQRIVALSQEVRTLYQRGLYEQATEFAQQACSLAEQYLGEEHPDTAMSLNNLAELYRAQGNYAAAEPLYQRALAIREQVLGEEHPYTAMSLNDLALLYQAQGNYAAAEPLYQRALAIREQVLGAVHPDTAMSLNNLAALYQAQGNYAAAEPLYQRALAIHEQVLGAAHPHTASSLNNLASLLVAQSQEHKALPLFQRALEIDERMLGQIFSISSEKQRAAFLKTQTGTFYVFLSLVYEHLSNSQDAVRAALALVLRRKAVEAEALTTQRDMILGGKYPALEPELRKVTDLRRQIAQKALAGPGPEGLATHVNLLADWNQQKEKLEAKLARQVPEMNLEQKLRAADRQAVAVALPKGSTFVEFVRFYVADFKAVPARGEPRWKPARYLAFVLPAGEPDNVQMIDLGAAEPIDAMIAMFRAALTGETESRGGRDLGELPVSPDSTAGEIVGRALRAALFDPVLSALGTRTRLLLAPDGDLTRLPFEVLPTEDGRRLIDEYQISYLGAGRDVLRFGAASTGQPTAPEVIADPDFDLCATAGQTSFAAAASPGRRSRDLDRSNLHFTHLPGTRLEGQQIAQMLGVQPRLAGAALEAQLKACRSPRILHLATHGFFLPDQKRDPNQELRAFGSLAGQSQFVGPGMENPLLRSGLALAGANWKNKGFTPPPEAEDGILTAEDVTGLDLLATDLVVLSACETGLGEIQIGEGVFGLRRAFVLAGAKTLVMSLWKVPDQQTQELMQDFYTRILAGEPRAEALRAAQLAMRQKHPEPLYWGAFICQGDPSPLL